MKTATCIAIALVWTCGKVGAETPWERYLDLPTPENASRVEAIHYSPGAIPAGYGYLATDLAILNNQVLAGDAEAFRLTYRLRSKADGGLLAELVAILGRAVRSQPTMFLEQIKSLQPDERSLESILMSPGLEYADRPQAKKYEIEMRRRTIAEVRRADLRVTRDRCVALMK